MVEKLRILFVDIDPNPASILMAYLEKYDMVEYTHYTDSIENILDCVFKERINTIFIDPMDFVLEEVSSLIFLIRKQLKSIVFVLLMNEKNYDRNYDRLYEGERERFWHYFKLDKSTRFDRIHEQIDGVLRGIQIDMNPDLLFYESKILLTKVIHKSRSNKIQQNQGVSIDELKELISKNQILEAVEKLKTTFSLLDDQTAYQEILFQEIKFNHIQSDRDKGLISYDQYEQSFASTINALLNIILKKLK